MSRVTVLQEVMAILTSNAALVAELKHTDATSIRAGARIVGDDVHLDDRNGIPLPLLIVGFEAGDAITPTREPKDWQVNATIYGTSVFQVARILDLLEHISVHWKRSPTGILNHFAIGPHQRFDAEGPTGRVIAVNVTITARWIAAGKE